MLVTNKRMAKLNTGMMKVRIKVDPAHPGRGVNSYKIGDPPLKQGESGHYDAWTARHLIAADIAEEVR